MKKETPNVNLIDPEKEILKQNARHEALRIASSNRPMYSSQGLGCLGQNSQSNYYDLLVEAEKIYQWLIKEL